MKNYNTPELKFEQFKPQDVITLSGGEERGTLATVGWNDAGWITNDPSM